MTEPQETATVQDLPERAVLPPPEESVVHSAERPARRPSIFELQSLLSIAVIVVFVITFVMQAFRVPSESMENTLLVGDFMLADKVHFADDSSAWGRILPYRAIQRGDIIVFRYPVEPSTYFVKRVIGVPGDRIRLQDKAVYLNGVSLKEQYAIHGLRDRDPYRDNFPAPRSVPSNVERGWRSELQHHISDGELVVPAGRYFVMGDNRDRSSDSRYWGFVPRGNILGRPLVIYLSVRKWEEDEPGDRNGKLFPSGQMLAHFLQLARWDRMFRLVR
jgi:signal peptidase I